jgi:hypothetical protein
MIRRNKKLRKAIILVVLLGLVNLQMGCYKYTIAPTPLSQTVPIREDRNIVLHQTGKTIRIAPSDVSETEITGAVISVEDLEEAPPQRTKSYDVAKEIHVYVKDQYTLSPEENDVITVPMDQVTEVMTYDTGKGEASTGVQCLLGGASIYFVIALILSLVFIPVTLGG